MTTINPTRTGAALAVTVVVGYSACALIFWLWPDAVANLMNALFHGLDFRKLKSEPAIFNFASFFYALATMVVWSFGFGAIFGWLFNLLSARS